MKKILYFFLFCFIFSCQKKQVKQENFNVSQARLDALSTNDHHILFDALEQINLTQDWYGTTYQSLADPILINTNYSSTAYLNFFLIFFSTEILSKALHEYLWYRFFIWGSAAQRLKHQQALLVYLQPDLLNMADPSLDQKIQLHSQVLSSESLLSATEKEKVAQTYKQAVHNLSWMKNQTLTNTHQIAFMNAVIYGILSYKNITTSEKTEYIQLFELQGKYLDLMQKHGVYIFDNYLASLEQLSRIDEYLSAFPTYLLTSHRIKAVSIRDNYPPLDFSLTATFNIFNYPIGAYTENGFPSDVTPYSVDVFSIVLAHEIAHQFDPIFNSSSTMQKRKSVLLQRAGTIDLNYLRSLIGGAFFQQNPQEFIASIFNQYFVNTLHTWQIATTRFQQTKEPMNQFVFILDLLSNFKGNVSYFYQADTDGKLTRYTVNLKRNSKNYIQQFSVPNYNLSIQLTLDTQGNITAYKSL